MTHRSLLIYYFVLFVHFFLQMRLPLQPPMAVLASKTAEGMLGLRWSKVKMGAVLCPDIRSVQVRLDLPC